MEEGFFLDRVNMHGNYLAVDETVKRTVNIFADITDAPLPVLYLAVMRAQKTPDFLLIELFIKHCLFHDLIISGKRGFSSATGNEKIFSHPAKKRNEGHPVKKAIFATSHKLIRVIFAMLSKRTYIQEECM
jgi:hypothetical protein